MKTKILVTISFILPFMLLAQSNYYYYGNKKIPLILDKGYLAINSNENNTSYLNNFTSKYISQNELLENNDRAFLTPTDQKLFSKVNLKKYYTEIKLTNEIKNNTLYYTNFINVLNNEPSIIKFSPCFTTLEGKKIGLTNNFYVKLKNIDDKALLYEYTQNLNLEIIGKNPYMPLWYVVSSNKNNLKNALEYANQFHESGLFFTAEPEFMCKNLQTSDPFYPNQWGLKNTGQHNSSFSGVDINIEEAWNISTGNNIKIAVFDQGFEMNHPDLLENVYGNGYDAETNTSPSQISGAHGTACAGIIGAVKDNGIGISGVAPNSNLVSISINLDTSTSALHLARGFDWAAENDIDVISCSWTFGPPSLLLTDAINNALTNGRNGKGLVVVFGTGNYNGNISYPANSLPGILTVGAMSPCGERITPNSCDGENNWGSNYGAQLDIMAPGVLIPTTDRQGVNGYNPTIPIHSGNGGSLISNDYTNQDYTVWFNGTSSATPHIAGIAALILSINPCLSAKQVNYIIETTAQKTGNYLYVSNSTHKNGTWNEEMGYGLADAYQAVLLAQQMNSPTLDLYVKDSPNDSGLEPNTVTQHMWTSDDIWIRASNDNGLIHQNPRYNSNNQPNYINIRVINKSCVSSTGNETLTVNWAKANTALQWPQNWDGSTQNASGYVLGGEVAEVPIPIIEAGKEVIITLPWVIPNPDYYSDNDNPWHFCLLSRINSINDPLSTPMVSDPNTMVRNNNNLAWKNITVVDLSFEKSVAKVMIANPYNISKSYYLEFLKENNEEGKSIYKEAEVTIKMDDIIFNAWQRGGEKVQFLANKNNEKTKLVNGNNAVLKNIMFSPNEKGLLTLDFSFLTKELTNKSKFIYQVIQKETITGKIIGGETFIIQKEIRPVFLADAGNDKELNENETIIISAKQINEAAIYNWYDTEGNLIYQGKDLTISATVTKKYRLEIIAETDGFKDYDEVEIKLKPSIIESISPNPSTNQIEVNYKLNGVNSAYLMILGQYGNSNNISSNYILDISTSQTIINVSTLVNGFYTVALVCNGNIVDLKTLIKQ